jgi:geranylgeranyl pyrophosphate synthase
VSGGATRSNPGTSGPASDLDRDALTWLVDRRAEIDALLSARLPDPVAAGPGAGDPGRLVEAMRYSLLSPGKRLRPLLALAAAEAIGVTLDEPLRVAAAAVELVHCYSLVHDDLPAMDDDDLRRGRPTSHKVFGEATAILAGDALLTLAFEWIADAGLDARRAGTTGRDRDFLAAGRALARGAGMGGMVRGQARDLGEASPTTFEGLEELHREKTGALFRAAVEVGCHAAGAREAERVALLTFAERYGLAFQHADDLDDGEHGAFADGGRRRVKGLTDEAIGALASFGPGADPLRAIARQLQQKRDIQRA